MTPHDCLADGRLADAIAMQESMVRATPGDPAARRFLVDLLAFAGRFDDALSHLGEIKSEEAKWADAAELCEWESHGPKVGQASSLPGQAGSLSYLARLTHLVRADRYRSIEGHPPRFNPDPPPRHAIHRWEAIEAIQRTRPLEAIQHIDEADESTPEVWGFIDGHEFEGLRDADDCFASVLEAFRDGEYHWFAWEALRKVEIRPAENLLDQLYRPATITLKDKSTFTAYMPLVYPGSFRADGHFALGLETDHICSDDGPTRCLGGKLLLVGDDEEVALKECRMIEIR